MRSRVDELKRVLSDARVARGGRRHAGRAGRRARDGALRRRASRARRRGRRDGGERRAEAGRRSACGIPLDRRVDSAMDRPAPHGAPARHRRGLGGHRRVDDHAGATAAAPSEAGRASATAVARRRARRPRAAADDRRRKGRRRENHRRRARWPSPRPTPATSPCSSCRPIRRRRSPTPLAIPTKRRGASSGA